MTRAEEFIAEWRVTAGEETVSSASRVQDRLFELYGELRDLPAGRMVESWLTLTIQRDLFSGAEILAMLDELEAQLREPVTAS